MTNNEISDILCRQIAYSWACTNNTPIHSILVYCKNTKYTYGEMVEWSMAHAWKACEVRASAGSNPVLSAKQIQHYRLHTFSAVIFYFTREQYLTSLWLVRLYLWQCRPACPQVTLRLTPRYSVTSFLTNPVLSAKQIQHYRLHTFSAVIFYYFTRENSIYTAL